MKYTTKIAFYLVLVLALISCSSGGDDSMRQDQDMNDPEPNAPDARVVTSADAASSCLAEGQTCGPADTCCRGSCENDRCQCQSSGLCFGESDCCDGYSCSDGECRGVEGTACSIEQDCAVGLVCHRDVSQCGLCKAQGEACISNQECCDSLAGCGFNNLCN